MNFKKITAIGTSVLIAGMTMGLAAAATYPAPFVQNGAGDFAVVYGTGAGVSPTDLVSATALADALSDKVTSTAGLGSEKVQIKAAGTDLTFGAALSGVKGKITSTHLPELLATRKIRDASGTIDYEQYLTIGNFTVDFASFGDDVDYVINTDAAKTLSPVLHLADAGSGALWELVVEFDDAVNLSSIRDGEYLTIAGKDYAVAKDVEAADTELVLYASSQTEIVPATETKTVTVDGKSYEIYVEGANTDAETATVYINGNAESVEEGDFVYSGDQEFYINRIFMQTVPTPTASVEIFIGAEKLTLEVAAANGFVEVDGEEIPGVEVAFTDDGNDLQGVETLTFTFTPSDLDLDSDEALYIEIGETMSDPVFGTIGLTFDSASMDLKDEDKDVVEFKRVSEKLQVTFTNRDGDEYSFKPIEDDDLGAMQYAADLNTDGLALARNDIVILHEGTVGNEITRILKVTSVRDTEITFKDISTGDSETLEDTDEIFETGVFVQGDLAGGWDLESPLLTPALPDTTLYTENNAELDISGLTGLAAEELTLTVDQDGTPAPYTVTLTADGTGEDQEFTIELDPIEFDADGEDEDGENGYYLADFGEYAEEDLEDGILATFYIPAEETTYNVYVGATSEAEAETGAVLVKDSEVSTVATKNLIVVGGSCINSAAATLVGGKLCGDAWTTATNAGAGKFVIKSYASNDLTSKLAVLVAGYEVADTTKAVDYFQNKVTTTTIDEVRESATQQVVA